MRGLADRLGRLPFAGTAVALIASLTLWFENRDRVAAEDGWPTIAGVLLLSVVLLALLRPLAGSWVRAGLMAGLAALYVLYLPALIPEDPRWLSGILFLAAGVAIVLIARFIPRDPASLGSLNFRFNLLLVPAAAGTLIVLSVSQAAADGSRPEPETVFAPFEGRSGADSPDVWHIIFDRYAGRETLERVYGYDNRPFLAALRDRGFAVGEGSFANYQRTAHSVASTLNGSYLEPLAARMGGRPADLVPLYRTLTTNQALLFFERNGYETIFAGSWWNPTRGSRGADRNVNYRALPELARLILDDSVLGFAMRELALPFGDARTEQCTRANRKFARLREIAGEGGRKYVFAHFLVPHPPFVLNADGSCRSLRESNAASRRDNYVAQVDYVNREVLSLIDAIRAGPRPTVIVIHSDEGPWPEPHVGNEREIGRDPVNVGDWTQLSGPQLAEKMGILMAVRPADARPLDLPASPVDVYPAILRAYFGSRRGPMPTRHLLFESDRALYRFHDVGDRLRSGR